MTGLNIACGEHADKASPDWVSIDQWIGDDWVKRPHVLASATALPFCDDAFDRLYVGHFLEHLEWPSGLVSIGVELRRVCRPGAEVRVVGPAIDLAEQTDQPEWLLEAIRMDADWRTREPLGIAHAWTANVPLTVQAAELAGFTDVRVIPVQTVVPPEWPNASQAPWQVALSARVP